MTVWGNRLRFDTLQLPHARQVSSFVQAVEAGQAVHTPCNPNKHPSPRECTPRGRNTGGKEAVDYAAGELRHAGEPLDRRQTLLLSESSDERFVIKVAPSFAA